MSQLFKRLVQGSALVLMAASVLQLVGCSSPMPARAPVEDRSMGGQVGSVSTLPIVTAPTYAPIDSRPLPSLTSSPNAGKPGYYTVKPGDTVMQIGRNTSQNWRDIVKWNNLESPNQIEVGQVLRVVPTENFGVVKPSVNPPVVSTTLPTLVTPSPSASQVLVDDEIAWMWPSTGSVIAGFDAVKNKGLNIAGRVGDPIYAAADGQIVHAGIVRGYGNLIIIKHNETYLTAYAHNQTILVKENQYIRKGQRIADMGNSDAERVMLHFEVRRNGKPVDPAKYLPWR